MIKCGQRQIGAPYWQIIVTQNRECLRRRDFVDDMQIDIQDSRDVRGLFDDDMIRPDLLEQGCGCAQSSASNVRWLRESIRRRQGPWHHVECDAKYDL